MAAKKKGKWVFVGPRGGVSAGGGKPGGRAHVYHQRKRVTVKAHVRGFPKAK